MKQQTIDRLSVLRSAMTANGIDAVIINKTDPHQNEYISEHWALLKYISGFTGSNATLVVTAGKALLWTDSRYFLQAAIELEGTTIELMKEDLPGTPSVADWLCDNLAAGRRVGINGQTFSALATRALSAHLASAGIILRADFDPMPIVWSERPGQPKNQIFVHELKYAGESAADKIARVLEAVHTGGADAMIISALDEIAWVLNIRALDIPHTTVATSFLYLSDSRRILFIDADKVPAAVASYLGEAGVEMLPYDDVYNFVSAIPADTAVLVEPARNCHALVTTLGDRAREDVSPVALMKACKNETQIRGIRAAMERDGVALVRAFMELENIMAKGEKLTELDVVRIFHDKRAAQDKFYCESFGTIAGFGPHGAIVHYEPEEKSNAVIENGNLLLIDSGAQYLDGTTDITRTIAVGGQPTEMQRHDFTLVMKGHIALGSQIFPAGTTGHQLDALARHFLWNEGLNYLHGTGHGVGHFLNVHEGPQSVRLNHVPVPLMPGMLTSNEPGLYRADIHGIRCENLVLTVKDDEHSSEEFGTFLRFETMTLFPFDLTLFDTSIMSDSEISWVNSYHRTVRERLTPHLDSAERTWLERHTCPLKK